jgi:hypothetical protein
VLRHVEAPFAVPGSLVSLSGGGDRTVEVTVPKGAVIEWQAEKISDDAKTFWRPYLCGNSGTRTLNERVQSVLYPSWPGTGSQRCSAALSVSNTSSV